MSNKPVAFPHPPSPHVAAYSVEYVEVMPLISLRCNCTRQGTTVVIRHAYVPGICRACKAQYFASVIAFDLGKYQRECQEKGVDFNINATPMQVNISRVEPIIMAPNSVGNA